MIQELDLDFVIEQPGPVTSFPVSLRSDSGLGTLWRLHREGECQEHCACV